MPPPASGLHPGTLRGGWVLDVGGIDPAVRKRGWFGRRGRLRRRLGQPAKILPVADDGVSVRLMSCAAEGRFARGVGLGFGRLDCRTPEPCLDIQNTPAAKRPFCFHPFATAHPFPD